MTNCINCGAPLSGDKCEYCGTVYVERASYKGNSGCRANGTLNVAGETFTDEQGRALQTKPLDPMIAKVVEWDLDSLRKELEMLDFDDDEDVSTSAGRDISGRMIRRRITKRR